MHVNANWQVHVLCYKVKIQISNVSLLTLITGAPPQKDDNGRGGSQVCQGWPPPQCVRFPPSAQGLLCGGMFFLDMYSVNLLDNYCIARTSIVILWFFCGQVSQETDPLVYISVPRNQARSIIQHGMADTMVKREFISNSYLLKIIC